MTTRRTTAEEVLATFLAGWRQMSDAERQRFFELALPDLLRTLRPAVVEFGRIVQEGTAQQAGELMVPIIGFFLGKQKKRRDPKPRKRDRNRVVYRLRVKEGVRSWLTIRDRLRDANPAWVTKKNRKTGEVEVVSTKAIENGFNTWLESEEAKEWIRSEEAGA